MSIHRRSSRRACRVCSIVLVAVVALIVASPPGGASRPGDGQRFDTWVGYDVGRAPAAVVGADLDGDSLADAAWIRDDFFDNSITVTLNLGEGTLGTSRTYATGSQSTGLAAADLDGDRDVDLAVSSRGNDYNNGTVDLFFNDGAGTFTRATARGGSGPEAITGGDFDDDGDADLVLANYWGQRSSVSILRNDGSGGFGAEEEVDLPRRVSDVAVGDVTGDDVTDIAAVLPTADDTAYLLHVVERGPDGAFAPDAAPQRFPMSTNGGTGGGGAALAPADLDEDGDLDLAASGVAASEHVVLLNRGDGSFTVDSYQSRVARLVTSDMDGDADVDLVGVGGGGGVAGTALVQRNTGDGTFGPVETFVTGSNPVDLATADLQNDGRLDVLVAARDIGAGVVHRQREDGSFGAPEGGRLFAPSVDVATGDVDADGDVDVAAAMGGPFGDAETIEVRLNLGDGTLDGGPALAAGGADPRSLVSGDLDADGDADLSWLVGHGSAQRVAAAESNGDGTYASAVLHAVPTCSDHLSLGDVDDDGDLDQVVGNEDFGCETDSDAVSITLNNGSGRFPGPAQLVTMTHFPTDTEVADMNDDGVADLVGGGSGQGGQDDMAVALGNGDGSFADPILTSTGLAHRELVVRDLDADGWRDVASIASDQGVVVLRGNGGGGFSSHEVLAGERISGYRNAVGLAIGDVDGDRIPDIAVANETGSDVGIHSGLGDGTFEPSQVRYGMRPRVTDVELADLDRDGILDVISPAQLPSSGFARVSGGTRAVARVRAVARTADAQPTELGAAASPGPGLTLLLGNEPVCTIVGTKGRDTLIGTRAGDVICGRGGRDRVLGGGAGDVLRGGSGNDRVRGGPGVDVVSGHAGEDDVRGGAGVDFLRGGTGPDVLRGGQGRDVVDLFDGVEANDRGVGGTESDHCRADRHDLLSGCR